MSAQGLKYMGIGLTFCGAAHLNYERASVLDSIGSYDTTEAKIGIVSSATSREGEGPPRTSRPPSRPTSRMKSERCTDSVIELENAP